MPELTPPYEHPLVAELRLPHVFTLLDGTSRTDTVVDVLLDPDGVPIELALSSGEILNWRLIVSRRLVTGTGADLPGE